jgi:CRISPR-associated protein Cmr4
MKFSAFLIECVTNLHVGSGDSNYGIVDNLVQRDPVTNYPTIHASSLKGALREHFKAKSYLDEVFGKEGKDGNDTETGNYKFLSSDLFAIPIRCTFENYVLGINQRAIEIINNKSILLINKELCTKPLNSNSIYNSNASPNEYAEEFKMSRTNDVYNFNSGASLHNFASFDQVSFESLIRHLPVIARNRLGENKNLWYEEIVPHKTLFITFIGTSKNNTDFEGELIKGIFQVGANSSVGYGLTKFFKIH